MTNFERITANVICVLEYATEILVAYQIYKLYGSMWLSILSLVALTLTYSYSVLASIGIKAWDIEKAKEKVNELQPYWLAINSTICIVLSRLG